MLNKCLTSPVKTYHYNVWISCILVLNSFDEKCHPGLARLFLAVYPEIMVVSYLNKNDTLNLFPFLNYQDSTVFLFTKLIELKQPCPDIIILIRLCWNQFCSTNTFLFLWSMVSILITLKILDFNNNSQTYINIVLCINIYK